MANGDLKDCLPDDGHIITKTWVMIDSVAETTDGVWIDCGNYVHRCVDVKGITTATVRIHERTTNTSNKPADSAAGDIVNSLTSDGQNVWTSSARWVKVDISSHTSGTIIVYLTATRNM